MPNRTVHPSWKGCVSRNNACRPDAQGRSLAYLGGMKKIGFLSFGHWSASPHSATRSAQDVLLQSIDLAVAAENAQFATPGVHIGLFCSTPMVALSRNVGRKQAMEMLILGDPISAQRAVDYGLINKVVPTEKLDDAIGDITAKILDKSGYTIKVGKEAFYRQLECGVEEAYAYTAKVMAENMMSHDAQEGVGAFVDKRKPVWRGE